MFSFDRCSAESAIMIVMSQGNRAWGYRMIGEVLELVYTVITTAASNVLAIKQGVEGYG